jgi:hypothetical protein
MPLKSFFSSQSPKIPLSKAILWIVVSTFFISTSSYHLIKYYFYSYRSKEGNAEQKVAYIVQTGPQKEALHSDFLAERIGLSSDQPIGLSVFDVTAATEKLKSSPVISSAVVSKIKPNIAYIDYTVRQPVAWLYDYLNVAIDKEGYLFPVYPFFSPKNLPEIYLGLKPFGEEGLPELSALGWGHPLKGKYIELAFSVLTLLQEHGNDLFMIKRIDVSHAFASTYGQREIIVVVENELHLMHEGQNLILQAPHILRLSTKNYAKELANYLHLRGSLLETEKIEAEQQQRPNNRKEKVIDLRIPQLAFIE